MVVVLGALIAFEYRSVPFALTTMPERAPQVYDDLVREIGDAPRAAIVELPLGQGPTYMYYSTFHWQVLLNGYSGFFPPSYYQLADAMATFPDPGSLQVLRRRERRFVLIHGELMPPEEYDGLIKAASAVPSLKLISRRPWRDREISLYRLLPGDLSALRPAPNVPGIHRRSWNGQRRNRTVALRAGSRGTRRGNRSRAMTSGRTPRVAASGGLAARSG
jgi:hypothetical protein